MVKTKPSRFPEGNELKNLTDKNKVKAPRPKRYRGKSMWIKTQGPELKSKTNFKVWCSGLEGCIFDIGPRALFKFASTMKKLERYLGVTYSDIF